MRITELETIPLSCPIPDGAAWRFGGESRPPVKGVKSDTVVVKLHTDEGVVGIGEPSPYGGVANLERAIGALEPTLVGEDPFDVARIADPGNHFGPQFGSGPGRFALAAVDMACWDAMGKATGQPVCKLLGGQYAERVPVYASGGDDWRYVREPERLVEEARGYVEEGFDAFKLRIADDDRFVDAVERVHAAVGEELDLILEGNTRFRTATDAIRTAERLRDVDPRWFEEPIGRDDLDGYLSISDALPALPLSGGEGITSVAGFEPWLDAGAYDIVQPDANVLGITGTKRVADLARVAGVPCVPHNWHGAITTAANLQVAAAIPNHEVLEYTRSWHWSAPAFQTEIVADPPVPEDGYLSVPEKPGLGIELDEDALAEYPHREGPCQVPWEDHPF
ncbi:MAG: mandelate racemase/muconate lactonizing enzyme family protein [Haloarculaceae archaeon]